MSPLKTIERYVTAIFKLGRTEWMAKQAFRRTEQAGDISARLDRIHDDLAGLSRDLGQVWNSISQLETAHDDHDRRFDIEYEKTKGAHAVLGRSISDLTRRLDMLFVTLAPHGAATATPETGADIPERGEGFASFMDGFYHQLENRFRGDRRDIADRVRIYLPDIEAAVLRTERRPVLDIGCGRGEWLELLEDAAIEAFGIDTNAVQIDEAKRQGLDVRHANALHYLADAEDNSLAAITAHHLVEHLPFDDVAWMTREALRVLAPGGLLLFETPHVRNVLVGATTFHTDPTHLKPMPEQVLSVLFETAGFHPIELRALHPHERLNEFMAKPDMNEELAYLMFGPQDLAILGTKPVKD